MCLSLCDVKTVGSGYFATLEVQGVEFSCP